MIVWEFILKHLKEGRNVALLYVLSSEGSSPGRQGFNMAVDDSGDMAGSIGGGLMEQKLVELAKVKLKNGSTAPFLMRQIHRKDASSNQSGMICSGEQTVGFYFLSSKDEHWVERLIKCGEQDTTGVLRMTEQAIGFMDSSAIEYQFIFTMESGDQWTFEEQIGHRNVLYIVGGGHVGQALSEIMLRLGFYIEQLDDREELNTMIQNRFAHKKSVIDYEKINDSILEGERSYVVLVSFGYRTDKQVLKKLLNKEFRYLGMMGSAEKVKKLFDELRQEGFDGQMLEQVHAPIGIPIHSKTPHEIAVSIAAEIVSIKNT